MAARTKYIKVVTGFVLCVSLVTSVANTQDPPPSHPLAPSDTSSPRATLTSLIRSCNELYELVRDGAVIEARAAEMSPTTERILDCLDLRELPKELRSTAGIESALFLKEVLDRIDLPAEKDIPSVLASESKDVLPPLRWQIPQTRIAIASVERESHQNVYLFTPETVRRAAKLYGTIKGHPYRTDGRSVSPGLYDAYVAATKTKPTQTAETSSPRDTLTLFLDTCDQFYSEVRKERYVDRDNPKLQRLAMRILSCLDTTQLPEYSRDYFAAEAAVSLKEVMDRIPLPSAEEIPGTESLKTRDGSEALVRWQVPNTQIIIARLDEGPHRGEFLFSSETVARAPEFFHKVRTFSYRKDGRPVSEGFYEWWLSSPGNPTVAAWLDKLPDWLEHREAGMAFWQWLGLLSAIPLCFTLMLFVLRLGRARGERMRERSLLRYWLTLGFPIVVILIPVGFRHFAWEYLSIRGTAIYVITFCVDVFVLIGIVGLIVGASSRVAESIITLPQVSPRGLDASLIRIICRVLGIMAAAIVFLEGGRYLGFPLTTLIASAGIGGLAVALSAQGLIKGLFGTVTILLDKPYRVGERIVVKGHDGIVEEIGLRSTKIRALTNHLISIPNDQMADAEIENIGKRKHIRRVTDLHIPLDTSREKVENAVACIRTVLDNQEGMDPDFPPRVHFIDFEPDAFTIRIMYWYTPADYWKYLAVSENINFEIFHAFEERGIPFSLPVRHTFWKRDREQGALDVQVLTGDPWKDQST